MRIKTFKFNLIIFFCICFFNLSMFSSKTIDIFPTEKYQSTNLYIQKGDKLNIEVTGKWRLWDKYKTVGGEGHLFTANELGNWGVLLGKIGNSNPIIIGKGLDFTSEYDGILYLYPNKGKYKIQNASGNLTINITGGTELDNFINQLSNKSKKITFDSKNKYIISDLYVQSGDTIEIYAFGNWTMLENEYPEVNADGHQLLVDQILLGKLYGGIGSSYGFYLEEFPIGERNKYTANKYGILSFFPYTNNYKLKENGKMDIYIIGGKLLTDVEKNKIDEAVQNYQQDIILNKLNDLRTKVGVPKLTIDPNLSKTAFNHAKYMIINNTFSREEEEGKSLFTGKTLSDRLKTYNFENKVREVFCQNNNFTDTIDLFNNSVYHRLRILSPYLKTLGYGNYKNIERNIHVIDLSYTEDEINWETIKYPNDNSTNIPIEWTGEETPDPLPNGTIKPLGYPISITFKKTIKKVSKSELLDENKKNISSYIITPDTDLNNKKINSVIIIPKKFLNNNKKYYVNIKVTFDDNEEKEVNWSFTTIAGKN